MRNVTAAKFASLILALATASAMAQQAAMPVTLKVGDAAPEFKVGKWVKGEPVEKFAPGTVYVIECWATWCGPCREAIPHVSGLQKKFEGKVVFIGADVFEEDESKVEPFVKEMGDKMNYRVVTDDKSVDKTGDVAKNWLTAAGQNGIPCSFVVNQEGKIVWIGHPMMIEPILEKVVAGKFDMAAAKAEAADAETKAKADAELNAKFAAGQQAIAAAAKSGDVNATLKAIDQLGIDIPQTAKQLDAIKFQVLLFSMNKPDLAYPMADKVYESSKDDASTLNAIAWGIATNEGLQVRDLKVARKFAERSIEASNRTDSGAIDTLARICFDSGEIDKAIELEAEAVSKTPAEPADLKLEMTKTLEKYKAAKK